MSADNLDRNADAAASPTIKVEIYDQAYTVRSDGDPDYLKGFAAGIEARRAVDLGQCNDLMSRDFANVAPAPPRVAGFGGDAAGRYTRGYQDGQRLVFGLESLQRLPQCLVPVPPTAMPGPAQR